MFKKVLKNSYFVRFVFKIKFLAQETNRKNKKVDCSL